MITAAQHSPALLPALQTAVPMWIWELRGTDPWQRIRLAQGDAATIAAHGDVLQFRSKQRGDTARAFNALARGLAIAAHQPGGVSFAGLHWCATSDQQCIAPEICSTHRGQRPSRPSATASDLQPRADR